MTGIVKGPAVWRASELAGAGWLWRLGAEQVRDADRALRRLGGIPFQEITAGRFPLPSWHALIGKLREEMVDGRGVVLLRGLQIEGYDGDQLRRLAWGICSHVGTAVTQTRRGELICDVVDKGKPETRLGRTFATREEAPFHVDNSDVVALMCLKRAKSGGASLVSSAGAIYNFLLERHPHLLPLLMDGFERDRRDEHADGEPPIGPRVPVFKFHAGRLFSRFNPTFIAAAAKRRAVALNAQEAKALEIMAATAKDPQFALAMDFQPGDLQFLCNYSVLHSRTGYEDHAEPERRRHLLRIWLELDEFSALIPDTAMRYGQIRYGNLGLNAAQWHARLSSI